MCPTGSSLPSREEAATGAGFRQAFDVLDTDRDGKISGDDLRAFYSGLSCDSDGREKEEIIRSMISEADSNRNGFVEYDEFERVLSYGNRKSGGGVMEDVFKVMDTDGDGMLSHGDLKSYMRWAGFEASDDDIKAMIKLGGGDEREGVSFDGLLKILAVDRL
ncbi:hypothetical protein Dsin_027844 [Dipteronia sinensis]|uniref:EF-hand domain-containing protein n=1 Tax=Dipteronia sinensis TaxID=43782 RepID=A0AAD9ZPJ2_9ROSI|nr:hypothetical protein Dsin_027844 [Dipteronia sinensis]